MEDGSVSPVPAARRAPSSALLAESPLRAIARLSAPTTAVMLIAATSNVLHTYFVSRLGEDAIAAVSLVFPISLVMITVMGAGLGTGVSSGIARALGGGRTAEARSVAEHAVVMTLVLAAFFTAALELGSRALFALMGGTGAVLEQATLFARTLFGGLLVAFLAGTFDSIMRGEGNVRIPAVAAILSLGLQIGLTPLLMFGAGLGLVGAPLATITGQMVGLVPRLWYIFGGRGHTQPRLLPRRVAWRTFAEILRVGVPASVAAILNYLTLIVLTGTFAHLDSTHLAAYGLGTRVDFLLFSLGYGVAAATITLVGMATGAERWELVGEYVRKTMIGVAAVVAVPCVLVIWRPSLWLGIFTDDPGIHRVGASYFHIVGPSYPFAMASMVLASAFQGLGRASVPLAIIVVRVTLVITFAIAITRYFGAGAQGVFLVIAAGNALSSVLLALMFRRVMRPIGLAAGRA
jgi:putative MATE family efflux protein